VNETAARRSIGFMERLIDHIDLRVHDLAAADAFYGQLLPELGFPQRTSGPGWICYDADENHPKSRFIALIEDREYRSNTTRIAFWKEHRSAIEALAPLLHQIGARNLEGPELCPEYSPDYFATFFEDPSGNRLEVCCRVAASETDPPAAQEPGEDLWAHERRLWLEGVEAYHALLDPEAIMAFAGIGIMRAPAILKAIERAPRWTSVKLKQPVLSPYSDTVFGLAYEVEARRDEGPPYQAYCTSTYRSVGGKMRLVQHQQTPRAQPQS
jgi:catechol 2,3-dioxygenase-like lactoylglutathione lyase family enzyme